MSDSLQLHNCSMPVFPVPHHFPEFAQVHVHCISDAIQSSYPLSPSSPLAFDLSQCPGLFQWISSSHKVAKVLELQLQHQSFQWVSELVSFRIDWLDLLPVQGTLKNLLQPHSLKASIYCYPKTNTSVLQKMMSLLIQKLGRQWTAIMEDIYIEGEGPLLISPLLVASCLSLENHSFSLSVHVIQIRCSMLLLQGWSCDPSLHSEESQKRPWSEHVLLTRHISSFIRFWMKS